MKFAAVISIIAKFYLKANVHVVNSQSISVTSGVPETTL